MHAVFMPYGRVNWVREFLDDIKALKLFYKFTKEGEKDRQVMAQIGLRLLPFGFYDVSFPREYKDIMLTGLDFHKKLNERYRVPEIILKQIRKALHVKEAGEFDTSQAIPFLKGMDLNHQDVAIIPIGTREDLDVVENKGEFKGWTHEAI